MEQAPRALKWAHAAGIKNWGYFIIGLPGETVGDHPATIKFAKALPLDIALFHVAAPYPGTPFFFEVLENNWFRPGTQWEQVDMDKSTVLDYPGLNGRRTGVLAKARLPRMGLPPRPDLDVHQEHQRAAACSSRRLRLGWGRSAGSSRPRKTFENHHEPGR